MNNARLSSFTSLSLKVLGGVLIFSSLVDYALVTFPLMPLDNTWQINFTNQVVGRGINPLLGIVALLLGSWIDFKSGKKADLRASITDARFLSFILSLILGVIFFLVIPLHIDNMQQIRDQSLSQIEQETKQREQQVQAQFNQLQALAQSPQAKQELDKQIKAIDDALKNGKVPPQQIAEIEAKKQELLNFQRFANDQNALNARLEELKQTVTTMREKQRQEAENTVLKEVVQISLRSLLLGIGYLLVGWLGVQNAFLSNQKTTETGYVPPTAEPTPDMSIADEPRHDEEPLG